MTLMVSASGIRGIVGESLVPKLILDYIEAFIGFTKKKNPSPKVVIGRDTRPTGKAIQAFVESILVQHGCRVVSLLSPVPTPTVAIAVEDEEADAGIIITASHNPIEWNALKFLNYKGEFLTTQETQKIVQKLGQNHKSETWNNYGIIVSNDNYIDVHMQKVLQLPYINKNVIRSQKLKILIDAVNGAGAECAPLLCEKLGVEKVIKISCKMNGIFPRNPEPIEENLTETMGLVHHYKADLGVVLDPDADRICFICENGEIFGEEYTLVACSDLVLQHKKGSVVNNLSSSRALVDLAKSFGVNCYSSKVGEANVVEMIKEKNAVIGGEGNGGVILPELHCGRDGLVGLALFLEAFCEWRKQNENKSLSIFKKKFPEYHIVKQKCKLNSEVSFDDVIGNLKSEFSKEEIIDIDGLKINFEKSWVHLRKSNTESIVRIYAEAPTKSEAINLSNMFMSRLLKSPYDRK